jgi:hypothetical protein
MNHPLSQKKMKKFTLFTWILLGFLPWLAAQQYYIEPYFYDAGANPQRSLKLFRLAGGSATQVGATMDISPDILRTWGSGGAGSGPNAVLVHQDKLFVSIDRDFNGGGVLMYKLADIFPRNGVNPVALLPNGGAGIPSAGMAIHPRTGDLFVATFNGGGIWRFAAPAYTSGTQFASGAPLKSVTANLAFDKAGNLWASTWDFSTNVSSHAVVCFKGAVASDSYTLTNAPITATDPAGASEILNAFSAPEGLAFDAIGNLWVANNNDGDSYRTNPNGKGTVTKIEAAKITSLLAAPSKTGTADLATALLIPGGKPGGLSMHGHTLFIGDQGLLRVSQYDVTQAFGAASYGTSGVPATYPGNGSGVPVDALYMQDNAADLGQQPNRSTEFAYQSLDIWVTKLSNSTGMPAGVAEVVLGGEPCSVFVKLRNTGIAPSTGTETLKLSWAKASTGLGWPSPWNTPPGAALPMGGSIGTRTLTAIGRGNDQIIGFRWEDTPDPNRYGKDGHFCLLARVETRSTAPFGMAVPETTDLSDNTLQNNQIAWRNIHITHLEPAIGGIGKIGRGDIIIANHSGRQMHGRVAFQLINAQGEATSFAPGALSLRLDRKAMDRLTQTDYNRDMVQLGEDGSALLKEPGVGLEHLILEPGETLACALAYTPDRANEGYAINVVQYALEESGERIVGGQTFVFGQVKGFPVAVAQPGDGPSASPTYWGLPLWIWLLILGLLILLLILFLIFRKKP